MQVNIQTYINNALEAEEKGVPVSWKQIALQIANDSNTQVQKLHVEIEGLKAGPEDPH